jgi:hypothetical protein
MEDAMPHGTICPSGWEKLEFFHVEQSIKGN